MALSGEEDEQAERIARKLSASGARFARDLLPELYTQLRVLAARKLASERPGVSLGPTALVHEAYLRVAGKREDDQWDGRGHFYAAAAEAMRRILIDKARRRNAVKHGGDLKREVFDSMAIPAGRKSDEILAVDEWLDALAEAEPRKAEVVKLRYFVGLTTAEIAEVLAVSHATVERDWAFARAWLRVRITGAG